MFMLRNVSKYLFGDVSKQTILELSQGQLYLVRPLSPKGRSELIFRDSAASLRRTGQQYQYQLVVQRIYEEGEAELLAEEEGTGEDEAVDGLGASEKDERTFLLDESLHLRTEQREGGEIVIAWRDLSGDAGDLYEFVCDRSVKAQEVGQFEVVAAQCQYERKYRKSHDLATEDDLKEFSFVDDEPIPTASPTKTPELTPTRSLVSSHGYEMRKHVNPARIDKGQAPEPSPEIPTKKSNRTVAPPVAKHPTGKTVLANEKAELHLFDFESGTFVLQDDSVRARVSDLGDWNYWLQISSDTEDWLGRDVTPDINPVFNFDYLSFIFNHYTEDGSAYSWLLRFASREIEEKFQEGLMQALWEHLNQTKWLKAKDDERDYVLDAFNDLVLEERPGEGGADDQKDAEDELSEDESDDDRPRDEEYDSDESQEDESKTGKKGDANSQLAVGYKHDRSFVVRGDNIGVFRHTADNQLKFDTAITGVSTPNGKSFSPTKVMLHMEDSNMILQNANNANSLYRMDLETGKVVDEWKVHDDIPVNTFAPSNKFAQMTGEQTFVGLSHNGLYRIDPRLSGNKLVDSELKQYATKNDFSAAATTEKGYIAVASNKGDIRMFDRLGINAKTHIPALGDPIIGVDVSGDGRWVLATTKTYILLIDAMQKDGKNEGKLGFEKSFAKDSKPQPRRLALSPAHVAQMQHETKSGLAFTAAHFNAGLDDKETTIVTSSGPFVISWSMKKVLRGQKDPYSIKRYEDTVKADNFKFGTDKNLIVALPNQVDMIKKSTLKRPTRESIAGSLSPGGRYSTPMKSSGRGTRGSYLKNSIVDSPY